MRRGILLILKGRAFGTLQQNTVSVSLQPDDNALRATTAIGAAGYKPTETKESRPRLRSPYSAVAATYLRGFRVVLVKLEFVLSSTLLSCAGVSSPARLSRNALLLLIMARISAVELYVLSSPDGGIA